MHSQNRIQSISELIMENQNIYSFDEIRQARKNLELEKQAADRKNISVEEYRLQLKSKQDEYSSKMNKRTEIKKSAQNIDFESVKKMVARKLVLSCDAKGTKFSLFDESTKVKYIEIIRYMFGFPTEVLNEKKFLYVFGRFGNGKSLLLKSCYSVLMDIYGNDNPWQYFHIPTLVNKSISEQSIKPFDVLFNCTKNIIMDEMGDITEKQKIYNDDKIPVRTLLLDKYDKWISNNGKGQKIAITSNLFPDKSDFYKSNIPMDTIWEFYDEKLMNKMIENYNLVRFPNISYRNNNVTRLS